MEAFEMAVIEKLALILEEIKILNSESSRRERELNQKMINIGKDFGESFSKPLKEAFSQLLGDHK